MIREATRSDIPGIRALMKREPGFWQDTWRADVLERALEAATGLAFVSVEGEEVVGFVCGHDLGFRGYLSELIVAKRGRHQGIGRALVARLEAELASRGCAILVADVWKDARVFYEGMGWSPPDVILLRKKLKRNGSQQPGAG
jgi:ribosomal protein S18 acetylase RimI-like enzyme